MELFTEYEHLQIEEVCRICLTKKNHMNLICDAGLADMLLECASIQVTPEDGLFNLVCSQCANEVSRWYVFKQQIIRSFEIGRWLINKKPKNVFNDDNTNIKHEYTYDNDENSVTSGISNSNSIIEDVDELKLILNEYSPTLPTNEISLETSAVNPDSVIDTINGVALNIVNNTSTTKVRKKLQYILCTTCGKRCPTTNSYNRHIKTHDDLRPHSCSKCDKSFKTTQVLAEHMKRHYDDRRHECSFCGQKFYAKASLNDHTRSHTGEKPYKCEVCCRSFATRAILRQHIVIHTAREKKFQCDICDKFLLTSGSLETHKRKHTGIKPFECAACDKSFFTKEAMQRHFSAIHDTDNNYLCNICSKVCSTKVHLSNHMKKKHLGLGQPANALCSDCGKQCGSAAELKVHVRVHTGERPYVCDICDKRFIAKGNLNSHKLRHSGKKPFLCNHCGKTFGEKSTLKVHERIHTGEYPYTCNICNKSFIQSSALRTHVKIHSR